MDVIELYMAADGRRWRRIAPNGRIVADGSQGYSRSIDAMSQILRTQKPPYQFRNLIGRYQVTVDDDTVDKVGETILQSEGELDEQDVPEPPDLPIEKAGAVCSVFEWSGQNLTSCLICHRPFWEHEYKATSYGNQPITDEEKATVQQQAEKGGAW